MSLGNITRLQLGNTLPFSLEPRRSFTTACPKCVDSRDKKQARSLSVYRDEDGIIRFHCNHQGQCEWNVWQQRVDPKPEEVHEISSDAEYMPVPTGLDIPQDYNGDALYWYRDMDGSYLFANRRMNLVSTKVYVPFIYTFQGFVTGKNAKWPKNFKGLYGAETIKGKTKAIIVEGEKAADAAKIRYPDYAVVSWLGGSNRGYDTADWSVLRDIDTVLLWPDNDEPGKEVMRKIAALLPCRRILQANVDHLPAKADLADGISSEDVKKAIASAHEYATKLPGVVSLESIKEQMSTLQNTRSSGFEVFDMHTKLPGSGLLVIEGRTKHGKSALAVALSSAMLDKGTESSIIYYSYEMTASKVYFRYLKSLNPNVDVSSYEGTKAAETVNKWITEGKLKLVDQSAQLSIADIVVAANKPQLRNGIIIIDYLQIVPMATSFGRNTRQLMLKEMLDELRVVAHKNNILVVVLSQLTPDYANPHNDSPREAKDIHYSADQVLRVWNKKVGEHHPTYTNYAGDYIIHTYLNRDGESNVKFEGHLEEGSQLTIKRRVRDR